MPVRAVMTFNQTPSPEQPVPRRTVPLSRARYRLLCSMLTGYAHLLVALAVAPTLFPVRQPPVWEAIGEIVTAMAFLAMAFFVAPCGDD